MLYGLRVRREANEILGDLNAISGLDDPTPQFELLKAKYGKALRRNDHCDTRLCEYELKVSNVLLACMSFPIPRW
jgi:hypothetical protein